MTGGWAYVERNGKFGFCAKSALTRTQADPGDAPSDYKKAKFKATVVYPGAKVYERASTSSKSKKLKLGKVMYELGPDHAAKAGTPHSIRCR